MWPFLLDLDKRRCKQLLRRYGELKASFRNITQLFSQTELEAFAAVITALRAQGDLNLEKRKILRDLSSILR